jgi:hypothetical protein
MAPRTRAKKPPVDQVYTSKPALVQQRFPTRSTKKTYGSARHLLEKRQSTLTQIDFGRLSGREKIEDSEEDEFEEEKPPRKRRKSTRRVDNAEKNNSRRKSAYTQTLTQMPFLKSRTVEDSEEEGLLSEEDVSRGELDEELAPHPGTNNLNLQSDAINDSTESTEETEILDSVDTTGPGKDAKERESVPQDRPSNIRRAAMPPPQTPKRIRILAVPSSQTPPTTPLSTQRSQSHSWSGRDRSPLQEKSTNVLISQEPVEDDAEPEKRDSLVQPLKHPNNETESPTKKRARLFVAQMDALRSGGGLQQNRRRTGPFEPGKIIRSSTSVSLASEESIVEVKKIHSKTDETQFAIGDETQAILGGIDLTCDVLQDSAAVEDGGVEQEQGEPNTSADVDEAAVEDENPIFEIGEPQEPLEDQSVEDSVLTDGLEATTVYPRQSSSELPMEDYEEEERVPSSQNETPRGTRLIHHEPTTQGRRVTFSSQVMLPIPQSPSSTGPVEEGINTQESIDPASVQLLYESQAYAALAASSPIETEPVPISSPIPSQNHTFRTPRIPRRTQAPTEEETQAPSTGRTESLSTTSGTYPKSAMKPRRIHSPLPPQAKSSPTKSAVKEVRIHSPPPQVRSSPTTPGLGRFLRGPITVSQLVPDSLRSDLNDSIGLPPRWAMDDEEEDDEL